MNLNTILLHLHFKAFAETKSTRLSKQDLLRCLQKNKVAILCNSWNIYILWAIMILMKNTIEWS